MKEGNENEKHAKEKRGTHADAQTTMSTLKCVQSVISTLKQYHDEIAAMEVKVEEARTKIAAFHGGELEPGTSLLDLLSSSYLLQGWLETDDALWRAVERATLFDASPVHRGGAEMIRQFVFPGPFTGEWIYVQFRLLFSAIRIRERHLYVVRNALKRYNELKKIEADEEEPTDEADEALDDFASMIVLVLGETEELLVACGHRDLVTGERTNNLLGGVLVTFASDTGLDANQIMDSPFGGGAPRLDLSKKLVPQGEVDPDLDIDDKIISANSMRSLAISSALNGDGSAHQAAAEEDEDAATDDLFAAMAAVPTFRSMNADE